MPAHRGYIEKRALALTPVRSPARSPAKCHKYYVNQGSFCLHQHMYIETVTLRIRQTAQFHVHYTGDNRAYLIANGLWNSTKPSLSQSSPAPPTKCAEHDGIRL